MTRATPQPGQPRPARRGSIGMYLGTVVLLQAFLFSVLTVFSGVGDYRSEAAKAATASASTATKAAQFIAQAVDDVAAQMTAEAEATGYDAVFRAPSDCVLTGSGTAPFVRTEIHLIRLDGSVTCTSLRPSGGLEGPGYASSDWLADLRKLSPATPLITGPVDDPLTGQHVLIVAARFSDTSGAVVTSLDISSVASGLLDRFGHGEVKPAFTITSADRRVVLARSGGMSGRSLTGTAFERPVDMADPASEDLDGIARIYGEAAVDRLDWHVWAGLAEDEILADAKGSLRETLVFGALALAFVLLVGALIHRRITRPVRRLAEAVENATGGDLTSRVPTDGPRELANLGERFNNMLETRARAEDQLLRAYATERQASDRLREVDQMKNHFLMAISHELRTPLTAVVGYASVLEDDAFPLSDEDRTDSTRRLLTQAKHLERMLVDLLDVERMSRGTIEAHRRDVDLRQLVSRIVKQTLGAKKVRVEIPKGLSVSVDVALMERVVENLIVNALKHTPRGTEIWVRVARERSGIVLKVEDSGPGVPDGIKDAIFEPFRQGEVPEHSPGTGIGLALVMQFAKLHGGDAWVADREDGGASFCVALPIDAGIDENVSEKIAS